MRKEAFRENPSLDSGLSTKTQSSTNGTTAKALELPTLKDQLRAMLKHCYDPEIPFNIVDLGLIYSLDLINNTEVKIKMTLTSPGCPVGPWLTDEVKEACLSVQGIQKVSIEIVFDPPWNPTRMSPEAHRALGL